MKTKKLPKLSRAGRVLWDRYVEVSKELTATNNHANDLKLAKKSLEDELTTHFGKQSRLLMPYNQALQRKLVKIGPVRIIREGYSYPLFSVVELPSPRR